MNKPFATRYTTFAPKLTESSVYPDQVAFAYGFPTGVNLSGRTIGILEFGGMYLLQDVIAYCIARNRKVPTITNVFLDGSVEQDSDASGEVCLDIDIVAEIASGVKIIIFFGANSEQGFLDAHAAAVAADVDVIANSWGAPESQWSAAGMAAFDASMKAAAEKGIATLCASGDSGSNDGTDSPVTDYPSCSPYAISCGGTTLELNPDGTRGSETAWSSSLFNSDGSGGGISSVYSTTPDWQKNILPSLKAGRRSPDISGNANPSTGYTISQNGQTVQVGGTSAIPPVMSVLFCIANATKGQHVGNLHTKLYAAPADCFFPITSGTNGAYSAEGTYSCVCGLGVPVADKLIAAL